MRSASKVHTVEERLVPQETCSSTTVCLVLVPRHLISSSKSSRHDCRLPFLHKAEGGYRVKEGCLFLVLPTIKLISTRN